MMDDNDYVLAFDHFYTTNHIQILKSLLPFMDSGQSHMLPAFIKYMELKYTLSLVNKRSPNPSADIRASSSPAFSKSGGEPFENIESIYKAVRKYLAPGEDKSFNQLLSTINTMKNVREMQQMMELFQSMNPDPDANAATDNPILGGLNFNGMDFNDLMQLFGGNNGGNK